MAIARHDAQREHVVTDVWAKLAAPVPPGTISWRQDGRPITRDGKFFARFVSYIDANTVRERLDSVVPGEWNLTLELLPPVSGGSEEEAGPFDTSRCSFKARLQILGVVREDVGTGKDYKSAATDAFKRVAVRFGIGHELYGMGQNWVQLDGDGKYAKPIEDPAVAYERRHGRATEPGGAEVTDEGAQAAALSIETKRATRGAAKAAAAGDVPPCPKCGGRMWDNRLGKRNPRAPDFKCRDRGCDGVIWPPKPGQRQEPEPAAESAEEAPALQLGSDEIPF